MCLAGGALQPVVAEFFETRNSRKSTQIGEAFYCGPVAVGNASSADDFEPEARLTTDTEHKSRPSFRSGLEEKVTSRLKGLDVTFFYLNPTGLSTLDPPRYINIYVPRRTGGRPTPMAGRSTNTSRRNLNRLAGRPPAADDFSPVSSTSP